MSLPESWVETTVGKVVVDLQPGFAQRPGEDDEGMTPQIRTHNISPEGKITLAGIKYVSPSPKELERYRLVVGDVVFNNTNSEEWVGKTAVFDQEGEYVFSNHMTRLRADTRLINPEYLASYLQLLWSIGYAKTRAKRWVNQAGIEGSVLASFKLPLPTLPEQQRIADVLQLLSELITARNTQITRLQKLIFLLFDEYFHTPEINEGNELKGFLTDIARINPVLDSPIDLNQEISFLPMAALDDISGRISQYQTKPFMEVNTGYTRFIENDVLFAKISPCMENGKIAIAQGLKNGIGVGSTEFHVLRPKSNATSEFLWALMRRPVFRKMAARSFIGTSGHQRVPENFLKTYKIRIPSYEEQRSFSNKVRHIFQELESQEKHRELLKKSSQALISSAYSGDLTEKWRIAHLNEVMIGVQARDAVIRKRGTKVSVRTEVFAPPERPTDFSRPMRQWLIDELSDFQHEVWNMLRYEWRGSVIVDDPEVFDDFCTNPQTTWGIEHFKASNKRIRQTLEQLAALGLIAKVSVPKSNAVTQQTEYLISFRPLREDENTRLLNAARLKSDLEKNESASSNNADASNGPLEEQVK